MISFNDVTKDKEHISNWLQIPNHRYRKLIIWGLRSRKTDSLLNMITHQPDIFKICLYDNDPFEAKLQLLINKREYTGFLSII